MPVPSQGHCGFHSFRLVTDFVCLYNYEFGLSLCKIVRSSVILLLPLLKDNFQDNWANASNNVNDIWETWKYIVNTAAESVARKVPKVKNYKICWDKGLDKILKRRQGANRLQRLHSKTRPYDSELGKQLSALYQKRKKQLHDAIVNKQVNNKINFLNDKCVGGKNKSKIF